MDPITGMADSPDVAAKKAADATEAERKHVALWRKKLDHARTHDGRYRDRWADDRRVARNETKEGEPAWLVDTNLIGAIIEVLLAFLYAKDPDVSVRPSPAVKKDRIGGYRDFADTIETVVSRLMKAGQLKRNAKRWIRAAMTVGIGWLKVGFQTRTERDPVADEQLNDLRDNAKQQAAIQAYIDSGQCDDHELAREKLDTHMVALQGQLERQVADGVTIDVMSAEDVLISPECGPVENYLAAPWVAFEIYETPEEVQAKFDFNTPEQIERLKSASKFMQRQRMGNMDTGNGYVAITDDKEAETTEGFLKIVEIWSKRDGVVFTMVEGLDSWVRPKYAPRTGSRFYPCFDIAFHQIDGERYPQSDVHQLKKLQDEYARSRSNFAEHRRRAVPGIMFDKTGIELESVTALERAVTQEYVGIKPINPGTDLRTLFAPKVYNPVDPGLYSTDPIRMDMEKVSGAQDAMQSGISVEKTATEAKIQDSGFGARVGARRDAVEDSLTEIAEYITQLALQVMDQADAQRYAGPSAVWTQLEVEEALTCFDITIKAGSTGKPKANSDREIWGTLLPLIQGMIGQIGAARLQGQEWAAKPLIALLEETFKRLDDPTDIERFLPVMPGGEGEVDPATGQPMQGGAPPMDPAAVAMGESVPGEPMMPPEGAPAPGGDAMGGIDPAQAAQALQGIIGGQQAPAAPAPPINIIVNVGQEQTRKTIVRNEDGSYSVTQDPPDGGFVPPPPPPGFDPEMPEGEY